MSMIASDDWMVWNSLDSLPPQPKLHMTSYGSFKEQTMLKTPASSKRGLSDSSKVLTSCGVTAITDAPSWWC
jgi:hypothetical protein